MLLSAREAFRRTEELRNRKEETLVDVLHRCNAWIEKHVRRKHTSCVYAVPEMLWGVPAYGLDACVRFLHKRLTEQGFCVAYLFPRFLIISWDMPAIHSAVPRLVQRRQALAAAETKTAGYLTDGRDVRGPPAPVASTATAKPPTSVVPPHARDREEEALKSLFIRSISDLKPSGRLVLDLS